MTTIRHRVAPLLAHPHLRDWRVLTAATALAILIAALAAFTAWGLQTKGKVDALSDYTTRLSTLSGPDLAGADTATLDALIRDLEELRPKLEGIRSGLGPARIARAVVGWLPRYGGQIGAAPELADRALWDVEAALATAQAARWMTSSYSVLSGSFDDMLAAYASGALPANLGEAATLLAKADESLARSEDAARGSAAAGLGGTIGEYAAILDDQEPRLRRFVDWATSAVHASLALGDVVEAVDPLLAIADQGGIAALSRSDQVGDMLRTLAKTAAAARDSGDAAKRLTPPEVRDTSVAADVTALANALNALEALGRGAEIGLDAALPALDLLAQSELGLLNDGERLLQAIDLLDQRLIEINESAALLQAAQTSMNNAVAARRGDTPEFFAEALDLVGSIKGALSLASILPEIGPGLLGADGPRTHLVLGQTSDELRASGGFVSGVWLVTFDRGTLIATDYVDVVEVDDLANLALYPPPPEPLEKHMSAPVWLMRDVGWDPDFPVTADIARILFRIGQGASVDGVIAITPYAFIKVADALGSIETPGGRLSADELLPALEEGTDLHGREYMDTLFQGLIETINGPGAREKALDLAGAIERSLDQKNVLVNLPDPAPQAVIERAGWSGALSPSTLPANRDRITPVDSNVGWSKVDRNIARSLNYRIELHRDAPARARLTLGYENNSGPLATDCFSQRQDRGSAYSVLKNACYWNYLRAYVHPGAQLVSADRMPLPPNSVVAVIGLGAVGDDTFDVALTAGQTVYGGLQTVPPHESREVTFVYEVPASVVDWNGATGQYTLELQAQPGAVGRDVRVTVALPAGYQYASSSLEPGRAGNTSVEFDFMLITDTLLTVGFQPVPSETAS